MHRAPRSDGSLPHLPTADARGPRKRDAPRAGGTRGAARGDVPRGYLRKRESSAVSSASEGNVFPAWIVASFA